MSKFRFIYDEEPLIEGNCIWLSEDQARHATQVLRLEENAEVDIVDGKGALSSAKIQSAKKTKVSVLLGKVSSHVCPFKINICFGISKGKALDFIFHHCLELGVHGFQPLATQHSLKKTEWNTDRWMRVLKEGIKQSQSLFVPELKQPLLLKDWLSQRDQSRPLFFCDENIRTRAEIKITDALQYDLLVGSEGGFSNEERHQIAQHKPHLLSLGENRLRTETAALVSCVLVKKMIAEL